MLNPQHPLSNPDASTQKEQRSALMVAVVTSFLTPFMVSAVYVALPSIARHFGLSAVTTNWVETIYLLSASMFMVPFGRAADIYGRKRIFSAGIIVYTLASLILAFCPSAHILIIGRIFQGIGGSMLFGTGIAIITSVYPPHERGKALGINVSAVYLGLALGPFLGGILTTHLGWRSIFFINIPIGLGLIWLVRTGLKGEWAGSRGERFDLPGAVLYGCSLALLMYGLSRLPHSIGAIFCAAAIISGAIFIYWETRARNPVMDVRLFWGNRPFFFSNLAALTNYAATSAAGLMLSFYLQYGKDFTAQRTGSTLVLQPIVMMVFAPFAGRLSDKHEPRLVASVGMALTAMGLFLFCFLSQQTALPYVLAGLVILGSGMGLFSSPNTNAIMSSVEKRHFGVASGLVGTMRLTGQMLSMGITMMLFALFMGQQKMSAALILPFLQSARTAFGIFFVVCLFGIGASLARGRIRRHAATSPQG